MPRPPRQALLPLALLVLLPLALLAPALAPGHALLSVSPEQLSPWRAGVAPERLAELRQESRPLAADKTLMFEPQLRVAQPRLLSGEAPLWNPDNLCGVPLLAQAVHGVLSPPLLLAALLGPTRAWAWVAALQVAVAGLLMYALAREYGLGRLAALLGGLTFAWCGFLAVRLDYYQIQGASVWLPAGLLGVERAFRGARWSAAALLGAGVGLSLLAGFPQSSVFMLYVAAGLTGCRLLAALRSGGPRGPGFMAAASCAGGLALGLALGAPQLLPSAELAASPDCSRHEDPPEAVAAQAMKPAALAAAVVPDLFGQPGDLAGHALPHLRELGVLRRLLDKPSSNWVETTSSIGLPSLLLALLGLASARRGARVAGALFLGGALLAIDTPLLPWVLRLPGLGAGDPRRFVLLFAVGGALLAGFGLQRLLDDGPPRWYLRSLAVIVALLVLAWGASVALSGPSWVDAVAPRLAAGAGLPEPEVRAQSDELLLDLGLLRAALGRTAVLAVIAGGAVLLATRRRSLAATALVIAAAADLLGFAARAATILPVPDVSREPPGLALLRDEEGGRLERFIAGDRSAVLEYPLPPDTGLPAGVHDLSGYITLSPRRVEALHEKLQSGSAWGIGVRALTDPIALDSPLLDLFAATRVVANVPLARGGLTFLGRAGDAWVYRNDSALPRVRLAPSVRLVGNEAEASAALDEAGRNVRTELVVEARGEPAFEAAAVAEGDPGSVRLVVDEPERMVLDVVALRPAVLVVADSYLPGWDALVDGAPAVIRPADVAFRAVALTAGGHRVELLYRPAGWR
ncbi:MAG TPA: hypothetical protein VFY71_17915, partial [Planctomycetota bacterium]|nr:hypothetical protein [Planctomycetota bacterium]